MIWGKENISIEQKLCKKPLGGPEVFPKHIFFRGGKAMLEPTYPIDRLYREDELVGGVAPVKGKFRTVVVSRQLPRNYKKELEETLPLMRLTPLYFSEAV